MALFSQRHGHKTLREELQRDSVDTALRNGLWTALSVVYWNKWEPEEYGVQSPEAKETEALATQIWLHYFKKALDTLPELHRQFSSAPTFVEKLRDHFFTCDWYEVYDLIEFSSLNGPEGRYEHFAELCNAFLKTEMAAYRLVN
jgi:hypothetical protein